MKDIQDEKIITADLARSDLTEEERKKYFLNKGDILINRTNSYALVGKVGLFNSDDEIAFASYLVRLVVDRDQIKPRYLNYWLNSYKAQATIKRIATRAVSQANINPTELKKHCFVPLPPITEQTTIATMLSTWDAAIEKTEQMIVAKEKQFSWWLINLINKDSTKNKCKKVKLEEIAEINKGKQLNVADMIDTGKYYVLNGGIGSSGYTDNWNTNEDTITISEGGNSCGYVNFNTEKFWCGGHCYALSLKSNEVENQYLYYFLKYHELSLMRLRVGSGLPNIQKKDLQNISVTFPPLDQQKQIVETLNSARCEIDLLKSKTEAFREQKRGLMQKLLTGKWRVKATRKVA